MDMYCEMSSTIRLGDTSINSYKYLPSFVVRTCNIYYFSKFQVYNTLLLTTVVMLYIRSPECIYL